MDCRNIALVRISSRTLRVLTFLGILTFCSSVFVTGICGQGSNEHRIIGRVVTEAGEPLPGAEVLVQPRAYVPVSFERFVGAEVSDENGKFSVRARVSRTKEDLIIESDRNQQLIVWIDNNLEAFSPLTPPFDLLRKYDRRFNGRPITLGSNKVIVVGDIRPQFWYGQLDLRISEKAFPKGPAEIKWNDVYLRIRNGTGKTVHYSTMSNNDIEKYVKSNGLLLRLSLPEGKWKVEIVDSNSRKTMFESPLTDIVRDQTRSVAMSGDRGQNRNRGRNMARESGPVGKGH
jgi:hypothetical protein